MVKIHSLRSARLVPHICALIKLGVGATEQVTLRHESQRTSFEAEPDPTVWGVETSVLQLLHVDL